MVIVFNFFKFIGWLLSNFVGRVFLRLEIIGQENIRLLKPGGVLFVANHPGTIDPFLIGAALPRDYYRRVKCFRFLTYYKYIRHRWYGLFIWLTGAYSVFPKRGSLGQTLSKTTKILKDGQDVLIFPTGSRNKIFRPEEARPGVAYIVKTLGCTIMPVYIEGTNHITFMDLIMRRRRTKVIIGPSFCFQGRINGEEDYHQTASEIMKEVYKIANAEHEQ